MSYEIHTSHESARGCGFRKPGGLYLVGGGFNKPCGLLPHPLKVCPTCGSGIKPTRGWTWVDAESLFGDRECSNMTQNGPNACDACPVMKTIAVDDRSGLLWIGGSYYESPGDFNREAAAMGISRRLSAVPKGFQPGKTIVLLAHRKAGDVECPECVGTGFGCEVCEGEGSIKGPAIFGAFIPTGLEYVVKGNEKAKVLQAMADREIRLVDVQRVGTGLEEEEAE